MAMVMEMTTAVNPIVADAASTAKLERRERSKNAMRRRRSEAQPTTVGPED